MKAFNKILISFILIISVLFGAVSCVDFGAAANSSTNSSTDAQEPAFYINGENRYVLSLGETVTLTLTFPKGEAGDVEWTSSHSCVSVENGVVKALSHGTSVVKAIYGDYTDSVIILVPGVPGNNDTVDSSTSNSSDSTTDSSNTTTDSSDTTTDSSDTTTDSSDATTDSSDTTDSSNTTTDDEDDGNGGFADGYNTITVAEALELAEMYTSAPSIEKYYVVARVKEIVSASNGRMYIYDETGTIYVYKSTLLSGAAISSSSLEKGDLVLICGTLRNYRGTLEIDTGTIIDFYNPNAPLDKNDPYVNVDVEEFYANYKPAISYEDAYYRTLHNLMSGTIGEQDQAPTISPHQPVKNGLLVRNTEMLYSEDGNTYFVVNAYGDVVMEIYRGGAYIMLEEVAAYVFAFGEPPANQTSSKKTSPQSSPWGIYLRLNHTSFSGNTDSYPYEPKLPNISGCGGTLNYYEMDIGTTGTDCDPSYTAAVYNNGKTIVRGAARIVYVCEDDDQNGTIDIDERYVFYTYNHYNDFQEYLNYQGGWGEMFGNITGGGKISSKTDYNPTPYVYTSYDKLTSQPTSVCIIYCDISKFWLTQI